MEIRVEPSGAATQCAVCHGALPRLASGCPDCGTRLHVACRRLIGRCPTLGCPQSLAAEPPRLFPEPPPLVPRRRRWGQRLLRGSAAAAVFLVLVVLGVTGRLEWTLRHGAWAELYELDRAIRAYELHTGTRPWTLEDLWQRPPRTPGWRGPYTGRPLRVDPWGWEYGYLHTGRDGYELVSYGADGVPGGEGSDSDLSVARIGAKSTRLAVPGQ